MNTRGLVLLPFNHPDPYFTLPNDIPLKYAIITGTCIGIVFYAIYVYVFIKLERIRNSHGRKNIYLSLTLILLLILNTADQILSILNCSISFARHSDDPVAFYLRPSNPLFATQVTLLVLSHAVHTFLLIWRLYVIWGRNLWIIAVPTFIETGVTGLGWFCTYSKMLAFRDPPKYARRAWWMMLSYLAIMILQYAIIITSMISKIWWQQRNVSKSRKVTKQLASDIIFIMVESGCISSMTVALYTFLWFFDYYGMAIVAYDFRPIIFGIIPVVIVYRSQLAVLKSMRVPQPSTVLPPSTIVFTHSSMVDTTPETITATSFASSTAQSSLGESDTKTITLSEDKKDRTSSDIPLNVFYKTGYTEVVKE